MEAISKQQCLPREQLKAYLAGWQDTANSDLIESHLSGCINCEQTLVELEADPDTLVDFLSQLPDSQEDKDGGQEADSALASAISKAHRLLEDSKGSNSSSDDWLPPADGIGSYEILEALGRGGMGSVYSARHRKLGKRVAIKFLPARSFRNDHFAARFQREIRAAGGLDHPAIVRATDAGEQDGTHYLVMECVEGMDLARLSRLVGKLEIADACEIVRQTAMGLSHAHAAGIVHRDVKPSNLMLSESGEVKILDFGLARVGPWDEESAELTTVGQLMGTLDYMAPEQAERADSVDYRADLYSLGATLFRLLCGQAPLAAAPDLSPLAKLRLLANHEPPKLNTHRPDAPKELVTVVESLLARDPSRRPASAAHVSEALLPLAEGHQLPSLIEAARQNDEQLDSLQTAQPLVAAAPPKSPDDDPGKSSGARYWITAAVLLPLLILSGVVITLETQKGQLVIESEAEISVELLSDGEHFRTLKIEPGAQATRLYAGKYQVTLSRGSDALQIDDGEVLIQRGETQIARVRRKNTATEGQSMSTNSDIDGSQNNSINSNGLLYADEPIYNGRGLSEWLNLVSRERSPEALGEAFEAVKALVDPQTSSRITAFLIKTLPDLDGGMRIKSDNRIYSIDLMAHKILTKANPGESYARLLVDELSNSESSGGEYQTEGYSWPQRILLQANQAQENFRPLKTWISQNVMQTDVHEDLAPLCGNLYLQWMNQRELPMAELQQMLHELDNCPSLGPDFLLQYIPNDSLSPQLKNAIVEVAAKFIVDLETPKPTVLHAALGLNVLGVQSLDVRTEENLQAALRQRFSDLSEGEMWQRIEVGQGLRKATLPGDLSESAGVASSFHLTISQNTKATAIYLLELLELAERLGFDDKSTLESIAHATESSYQTINDFFQGHRVQLVWGDFSVHSVLGPSLQSKPYPSSQDWIAYFLHKQILKMSKGEGEDLEQLSSPQLRANLVWAEREILKYDQNQDGQLSKSEWQKMIIRPSTADVNADEVVTVEELAEWRTQ